MNILWASDSQSQTEAQPLSALPQIEEWYEQLPDIPSDILSKVDSVLENHNRDLSDTERTYLYHIKSDCYYYLDDLRKSDDAIKMAIEVAPENFHPAKMIEMYNSHGQNLDFLGAIPEAIQSYNKGLIIAKRIKDSIRINELYYNIGLSNFTLSNLEISLSYMDSSQNVSIILQDSNGISGILRIRSSIYKENGNIDRAIQSSQEGLKYVSQDDPLMRCFHLLDISNTYYYADELDSLYKYAVLGKECEEKVDYGFAKLEVYKAFSNYYKEVKDTTRAIQYLDSLIELSEEVGNIQEYYLGMIAKYTFVIENDQISEAISAAEKAEDLGLERLAMAGFEKISDELYNLGRYKEAFEYLSRSDSISVKFNKETNRREVEVQAAKFNVFEKEVKAQLAEEKLKAKQAQFTTYSILGVSIFSLLFGWLIFRNKKAKLLLKQEKLAQEAALLKEIADVESQAFRAQMNPHFIFNALNSIKGLIVSKKDKEAALYISKFSKLVRNVLDHSRSKTILLSDELATLEIYIKLEQMRFRDGFEYQIKVDDNLEVDSIYILPIAIQPFVENSIWHGFKNSPRSNQLLITLEEEDDELLISIQDNGVGRSNLPKNEDRQSHGVDITRQRIYNFSKDKKLDRLQYFDIKNNIGVANGTLVKIKIPINYQAHE